MLLKLPSVCIPGKVLDEKFASTSHKSVRLEKKSRIATVDGCFHQHDDDVVLLQLKDGPTPLVPEQIAQLGSAAGSEGNEFQSYGYAPIGSYKSRYASGEIQGPVELDLPDTTLHSNPVQLKTEDIRPGMSGGAVLDKKRNLVIGLVTERWNPQGGTEDHNIAWATDNYVLTFDPIKLPLLDESLPMGSAFQPKVDLEAAKAALAPKQKCGWNNAPASIQEWVGRAYLLKSITNDWIDSKKRVIGLIGFGGEGKSSLVRRWIDDLINDKSLPQPDSVFWWGFYDRPSVDEFFEAALNYLSGGNVDLARLYPSSIARVHFLAGMLHSGCHLFILDGLEGLQHQEGDQFGLMKSNDLRKFLQFFAAPDHDSFCMVTSRVPLLDMMEYTTYQHRDVERLSSADGRALLKKLGVKGTKAELDKAVADWDGHGLTLGLIGGYLFDRYGGDIKNINEIPLPNANEPLYHRIHSLLRHYDDCLEKEDSAFCVFLEIFSAFRVPVSGKAFDRVFIKKFDGMDINAPLLRFASGFDLVMKRLLGYRILRYNRVSSLYSIHPLIRYHYYKILATEDEAQVRKLHEQIMYYYLSATWGASNPETLEAMSPFIEALHHACCAGNYDLAYEILKNDIYQYEDKLLVQRLCKWETALELMTEFFPDGDISKKPYIKDINAKYWLLLEIGSCLMNLGRLGEAVRFYERAREIETMLEGDWQKAFKCYQYLAELYFQMGEIVLSQNFADTDLGLIQNRKADQYKSDAFARCAWSSFLRGDLNAASTNFERAESLQRDADTHYFLFENYGILHADYLTCMCKRLYARAVSEENLRICESFSMPVEISRIHRVLGDIDAVNQPESAHGHYEEALRISRSISHRPSLIEALLARGRLFVHEKRKTKDAFMDLNEALDLATESGYKIFEADIRIALAWAYFVAGYKEEAMSEVVRAKQMSDDMGYYLGKNGAEWVLAEIKKHAIDEH